MARTEEDPKLDLFLDWLQVNGVESRGCNIKYSDSVKGYGIFGSNETSDGVLLVVPLDLAITPMRVLHDPLLGPECQKMLEEGEVDDRFLMILFLMVERLRKNSSWKPYLDMLPTQFGTPLWFTDNEMSELKGTNLCRATQLQKKSLLSLYNEKVESLVKKLLILDGETECEVSFDCFLWANSVFWSRALNIPLPRLYVFPQSQQDEGECSSDSSVPATDSVHVNAEKDCLLPGETVWVEGLVPGIDFCNHDLKSVVTWEVDGPGSVSRVPSSMYLISVEQSLKPNKEVSISYGNKGNEELLFLYGFVLENNPDDYVMIHYPVEALQTIPFSDSKGQLLEAQKAQLRCLLPKSILDKAPSCQNKLIFPEDFMTALRTIAMQEDDISKVSESLKELMESRSDEQPSESEVRAIVQEACGDSGALQLLVDLLNAKLMGLEEGSGGENVDMELLDQATCISDPTATSREEAKGVGMMSRNKWSAVVYRKGQKELTRLLLKEADLALHLCSL